MNKNDYKQIVADEMTKNARYEEALLKAVDVMEKASQHTTDMETCKCLILGFEQVKEILGIKEKERVDG